MQGSAASLTGAVCDAQEILMMSECPKDSPKFRLMAIFVRCKSVASCVCVAYADSQSASDNMHSSRIDTDTHADADR